MLVGDDPETDIAVLRLAGNGFSARKLRQLLRLARRTAGDRDRQSVRLPGDGDRRNRQRARPNAAHTLRSTDRERDSDGCAARIPATRAGRWWTAPAVWSASTPRSPAAPRASALRSASTSRRMWRQHLMRDGRVRRSRLQLSGQTITLDRRILRTLGRSVASAILILEVQPDGPAHRAGLENGDVLLDFDGEAIAGLDHLHRLLTAAAALRERPAQVVATWQDHRGDRSACGRLIVAPDQRDIRVRAGALLPFPTFSAPDMTTIRGVCHVQPSDSHSSERARFTGVCGSLTH